MSGWLGVYSSTGVLLGTEETEGVGDFGGVVGWTNSVKPVEDIVLRDEWWKSSEEEELLKKGGKVGMLFVVASSHLL